MPQTNLFCSTPYKKELLTEETKQIVLLDLRRDRAYTKFKTIVEGFAYDDETPANAAAKKLLTFIKQHGAGKLVSFDYNKETASITSLIADCRDHAGTELSNFYRNDKRASSSLF